MNCTSLNLSSPLSIRTLGRVGFAGALALASLSTPLTLKAEVAPAFSTSLRNDSEIAQRKRDPLNPRVEAIQPGAFPVGFYIYKYDGINENLAKMAELGFTSVHLIEPGNRDIWEETLEVCQKLNLSVLMQINSAYLTLESDISKLLPRALSVIESNKDNPSILAFSIKEEPSLAFLPLLQEYYKGIYASIPDAPIYLLHNYLRVMKEAKEPYPVMNGTDRYGFWWEYNTVGNRATPASALRWYHTQLNAYYQDSLRQNGEFFAVFSSLPSYFRVEREKVRGHFYPAEMPEEQRDRLAEAVDAYAEEGNQGWWKKEGEDDYYWHWKYYAAPKNTTTAMCWLSVMEGAKSVYCYHWLIREKEEYGKGTSAELSMSKEQIDEFSGFAREIQRYGKLIRAMAKEFVPYKGQPKGHEVVETAEISSPFVSTQEENLVQRSFKVDGYEGRVIVAVNTEVGSWVEGTSPYHLKSTDRFRIDEKGELIDYTPASAARQVSFKLRDDKLACLDLKTGEPVKVDADGVVKVAIEPGAGRFLFVYSNDSTEAQELRKEFGL